MASNPVLEDALWVQERSEHVQVGDGIESAARKLLESLKASPYSTSVWKATELHPVPDLHPERYILDWIFLVSALNFSFWSDHPSRFGVRYKHGVDGKGGKGDDKLWTGYWSLLAALHRAQEEHVDVTNPKWYATASEDEPRRLFRSDGEEEIPLFSERVRVLQEVGTVLNERFNSTFSTLVLQAQHSALRLVDLVVSNFPCFDDKSLYEGRQVRIRKRAQILVAETWAAFEGQGPGRFDDIDQLTMFADYRVPQILHSLDLITYSPSLTSLLTSHTPLPQGSQQEVEIRCLSIVAVDLLRRELARLIELEREGREKPNAVLLDFLLWDLAKKEEGTGREKLPHHRTRSVYY